MDRFISSSSTGTRKAFSVGQKFLAGLRKTVVPGIVFTALLLNVQKGWGQNAIVGAGFASGWGGACGSNANFSYFSAGAGSSYTSGSLTPNGTGNQYWRIGVDWGGTVKQIHLNTTSTDVNVSPNTTYTLNGTCVTGGAMFVNVSATTNRYVFKTRDAGSAPSNNFVFFALSGAPTTVSTVTQGPVSGTVSPNMATTITATTAATPPTGQGVWLRYTTDNFATSTIVQMTGSTTTYTANIPAGTNSAGTTVRYYVFTSGTPASIAHADADFYTINLNNNSGSNYSYTVANGWTTAANGNWGTAGTWTANAIPPTASSMGAVTIAHNVTQNQDAIASSVTINASRTLTATTNTLTINNGTSGTTFTNNGTLTSSGTHAVTFSGAATHTVSGTVAFNNVNTSTGVNFGSGSTVNGTFTINSGGFVATNAPNYGASSTLTYNIGASYTAGTEWTANVLTGQGVPNNVTLTLASTSLTFGTATQYRRLRGSLTISASTTLALSTNLGGDLRLGGNWTNSGTFTSNSRAVFFDGSAAQTINATATNFAFLLISNTSATVTANAAVTVTGTLTIDANARLDMAANTLTITGATSSINGFLRSAGTITGASTATLTINNGGTYEHNFTTTPGTIPTATWSSGSTCLIRGYTTGGGAGFVPGGINQAFSNFTWNCSSQSSRGVLNTNVNTTFSVSGTFSMVSTGTQHLALAVNSAAFTTNIANWNISGGNLYFIYGVTTNGTYRGTFNTSGNYLQSGGTVFLGFGTTAGRIITTQFNLTGASSSFNQSGGIFSLTNTAPAASAPLNVAMTLSGTSASMDIQTGAAFYFCGDNTVSNVSTGAAPIVTLSGTSSTFTQSGGTIDFNPYNTTPTTGTGVMNLAGSYSRTGTSSMTTTSSSAANGIINFNGGSTQTITNSSSGALSYVGWNVQNGSTVTLSTNHAINSTGNSIFTVANGGTINFGTNILSGAATSSFISASGSTLISANTSASGAINTTGANGSVQTTNRTFTNAGVNYTFNGASAQFTGTAIGAASNIRNLTFNTTGTLTLSSAATLSATGTLTFGTNATRLVLGGNDLTLTSGSTVTGAGSTKYVQTNSTGRLLRTALTTAFTFPVGNSAYNPITVTNSGVSDTYGFIVLDGAVSNAVDATKAVNRSWAVTEAVSGGGNLQVVPQFNTGEFGGSYATGSAQFVGLYIPSAWTENSAGASASGSNPFTVSASGFTNSIVTSGSTNYFAVGNAGAFVAVPVTYTWTGGAGNGLWTSPSNWSPGTSVAGPTSIDHVIIANTASTLNISGTVACANFTVNAGAIFAMAASSALTVSGNYTYNGNAPTFNCTSTLNISSSSSQTIPAHNYGNLNLTGGARVLASSGTIGICGTYTPGSSTTITGSTINFNGTGAQTINAIAYNNLTISNSRGAAVATLPAGTISVAGVFDVSTYASTANPSNGVNATSIFDFTAAGVQTIPAFFYGQLNNTGNGNRTWASSGVIDINQGFTPGSGTHTITSSTVRYSNTSATTWTLTSFTTNLTGPARQYNNLIINGGASTIWSQNGLTIGVAGDFTVTSGTFQVGSSGGAGVLNVDGNIAIDGANGTLNLSSSTGGNTGTINLLGNFSQSNGLFNKSGTAAGTFNFARTVSSPAQTISQSGGTITNNGTVWNLGTGSTANTVEVSSNVTMGGGTVNANNQATVDFKTFILSSTGTFAANTGTTLVTANTNATGAIMTSGANGSVQATTRTFTNAGVNYTFNGTVAQFSGNAISASANIGTLNLSNTSGANPALTFTSSPTIATALNVNNGINQLGSNNITITPTTAASVTGGSSTAFIQTNGSGRLIRAIATAGLPINYNFPIGTGTNYTPAAFNFTANAGAMNLIVGTVGTRNTNDVTPTDYINNRYWVTNLSGTPSTYTYNSVFTYITSPTDVVGTIGNIRLNRFGGITWTQDASSSASGSSLSSSSLNESTGSLAATAEWAGRVNPPFLTYTWDGSANNGSWDDAANWDLNAVPSSSSDVIIIPDVAPLAALAISGTRAVADFTVQTNGTFSMGASSQLTISGNYTYSSSTAATFNCSSTLILSSSTAQALPAANYGNLNLAGGARTLTNGATTRICGNYTAGTSTTVGTSTVEFNGTAAQAINTNAASFATVNITNTAGTVTANTDFTASTALTINSSAVLDQASGTMTLTGSTVTVNGTLRNSTSNNIVGGTITVSGTGTYDHNRNSGVVPAATWQTGSTCLISGTTSAVPTGGLGQAFSDFTWNTPGMSAGNNLSGALTNVGRDLRIISTGTTPQNLGLVATTAYTGTVGRDLLISGGNLILVTGANSNNVSLGVTRNVELSNAASFTVSSGSGTGTAALNVTGTFTNGSSNASSFVVNSGTKTVSVAATVTGAYTHSGSGTASVNTNSTATTVSLAANGGYTISAGIQNVANGGAGTLSVANNTTLSVNGGTLNVAISGTGFVNAGTSTTAATTTAITLGGGSLVLASGGTGTINAYANLNMTSGSISRSSGTATINFLKPGTSQIDRGTSVITQSSGTFSGTISINIGNSTAIYPLLVLGSSTINIGSATTLTVTANGMIDCGASNVLTGSTFTLATQGTLVTANTAGITTGASGSIQTTTRNFGTLGYFIYNGTSPQVTGNAFPSQCAIFSVFNSTAVNLTSPLTIAASGQLIVFLSPLGGILDIGNNDLTFGTGATVTGAGASYYIRTSGTGRVIKNVSTAAVPFEVGNSTYNPITLTPGAGTNIPYQVRVIDGITSPTAFNGTKLINRYWSIAAPTAPSNTLTMNGQWSTGNQNANYNAGTQVKVAYHNGTIWNEVNSTQAGANPFTSSGGFSITNTILNAGITFGIGKDDGFIGTYVWNGSSSSLWTDQNNWTPTSLAGGPIASDNVRIDVPGSTVLNINSTVACNNFELIGTGTFNMGSSGVFTINGNVTYSSSSTPGLNCASTINIANSGSQPIPPFNYGNLNATGGDRVLSNTGTIGICGTFTRGAGAYTVTGSTVNYNGSGAQTISAGNYNNLTISNARGTANLTLPSGTISVAGTFDVSTLSAFTPVVNASSVFDFTSAGAQTIPAFFYGQLNNSGNGSRTWASSGTIDIAQGFSPTTATNTITGSTIRYSSTDAVTLTLSNFTTNVAGRQYNNLEFTGGASTVWQPGTAFNFGVAGNLTLSGAGRLIANPTSSTVTWTVDGNLINSGSGNITLSNSTGTTNFNVTGNTTLGTGSGTLTVVGTSTGSGLTTTFTTNDLSISGTAGMNLDAASNSALASVTVNGNVSVTSTAANAINLGSGTANANNTLNVKGNFTKSGTGTLGLSGTYSASAVYNFNGSSTQTWNHSGAAMTGGGITVASGSTLQLATNLVSSSSANANPISISGTLDCQTFVVQASNTSNTFSLGSAGTLITASSSGVAGAISGFTPAPGFASGATFVFSGANPSTGFSSFSGISGSNTYSIIWQGTGNLTLDKTVQLSSLNLVNNGLVVLGSNSITITSAGSISGSPFSSAKMIVADGSGSLTKVFSAPSGVTFLYPLGDVTGTVEYSPVSITITSASSGSIGFRVVNTVHPSNGLASHYVQRYWPISNTYSGSYTWTGSFTYTSADVVGTQTNNRLNVYDNTNLGWIEYASNSSAAGNILTISPAVTSGLLNGGDVNPRQDVLTYFRSAGNGNWSANATWLVSTDPNFTTPPGVAATFPPNYINSGGINIQSGHVVTVTTASSPLLIDQTVVNGTMVVNNSVSVDVNDGSGTDFTLNGTVNNNWNFYINPTSTGSLQFNANSVFSQIGSGGSTPYGSLVTWDPDATLMISGIGGGTAPGFSSSETYGNVEWDVTGQSTTVNLTGTLANIGGRFRIFGTGAGTVRLTGTVAGQTITIAKDLLIEGGTLEYSNGNATTSSLNIGRSFLQSGGTFSANVSGSLAVNFTGTQGVFNQSAGTLTNTLINWTVNSGAILGLTSNLPVATSRSLTITGTLNTGTAAVTGAGTVSLSGTLGIGSPDGIVTGSTTAGNLRNSGTRTLNPTATYRYNGSSSQTTGTNLPTSITGILEIVNTGVSGSNTVTLTNNNTTTATLNLSSGLFAVGTGQTTNISSGGTVNGNGGNLVSGAGAGTVNFQGSGIITGTVTFNNVSISGAVTPSTATTINGTLSLNSTSASIATRSPLFGALSTLNYNYGGGFGSRLNQALEWPASNGPANLSITNNSWIQLTADRSLTGNVTITNGALQASGTRTLTMNGSAQTITVSSASGGAIYGTDNGVGNDLNLAIANGSTTTFTGDPTSNQDDEKKFLGVTVNATGTLILQRGILVKYGSFNVNGTLQINSNGYVRGDISGNTTNIILPTYGSTSTLIYNAGVPYTVGYEWTGNSTSAGLGVPGDVTIQNSTTVNFPATNRGCAGNFNIISGVATLNASSGDLYVAGNFTNSGTFTHNNRAVFLNGGNTQTLNGTLNGTTTTNCFPYLIVGKSANGVTLNTPVNVTNTLTLTSGIVTTDATNFLHITNTSAAAISGGSTTTFINGPLRRTLASGLSGVANIFSFPVGAGTTYLPLTLDDPTTGATGPVLQVTATNSGSGGSVTGSNSLASISSTEFWQFNVVSGNFSNGGVDITRQTALAGLSLIGRSTNQTGLYESIGGSPSGTSILGTANALGAITSGSSSFLVMGNILTPSISSVSPSSGYFGQSFTVNGSGFASNATVSINGVGANITSQNSSAITATITNTGAAASGLSLVVTNPSNAATAGSSFNFLGHITAAATDWNTNSTWVGNAPPTSGATIVVDHNITVNGSVANAAGAVTINAGDAITFGAGGTLTATNVTNNGSLVMTSGGTLTIASGGTLANGINTFSGGSGTVAFAGSGTISGTIGFNNVNVAGGVDFGTASTINGIFRINSGGFVSSNAPLYAAGSTLEYNTGGNYNRGLEWNASTGRGYPHHVTISGSTNMIPARSDNTYASTAFQCAGNLTIGTGSSIYMDNNFGANNMSEDLRVLGNLTLQGNLSGSQTAGSDIFIGGNWTNNGSGSNFSPNGREVVFNGSSAQTIGGSNGTVPAFAFLAITTGGSDVTSNLPLTINNRLQLNSGKLIIGNNNLTIAPSGLIDQGGLGSFIVTNGTGLVTQTMDGGNDWYPVGPATNSFAPVTLNQSGTSETIGVRVINVAGLSAPSYGNAVNDTTQMLKLEWVMNESVPGANSIRTTFGWQGAGTAGAANIEGSGFDRTTAVYHGNWTGSRYAVRASNAVSGTNPYFSLSTFAQPYTGTMSANQRFVLGNINGIMPCFQTAAAGDWNTSSNWADNLIPPAEATVCINHAMTLSSAPPNPSVVTIGSSGNLSIASGVSLTLEPGGTFTNNRAGFNMTSGTLVFQGGTSTINGSQAAGLYNLEINGNTTLTTVPTINNQMEIKAGGFIISGNGPVYGSSSTLIYNTGGNYNRSNEWRSASGAGYPASVLVTGNTSLNLNAGTAINRSIQGNMQIDNGSSVSQGTSSFDLIVPGNFTLNGSYTQSSTFDGDLILGGNWTSGSAATLTSNNRDVSFNGNSGTQTISNAASGLQFGFLTIDNTGAGVNLLNNITASTFRVNPGRTFSMSSSKIIIAANGEMLINGTFNANNGTIEFTNGGRFRNNGTFNRGTSTLDFLPGAASAGEVLGTVQTNFHNIYLGSNSGIDFNSGAIRGRISGVFQLRSGSYVSNNAPIYESGSKLMYSGGGTFNRNVEWDAATLQKVEIRNNTILKGGTNGTGFAHTMADSLIIQSGSVMDLSSPDVVTTSVFGGSVMLRGTLTLSNASGADLRVAGDWNNDGGTFNCNGRLTTFDGAATARLKGPSTTTFCFLTVNKSSGVSFTADAPVSVSRPPAGTELRISGGTFDLNGQSLNLGAGSNTLRINEGDAAGQTLRTGGTSINGFNNYTDGTNAASLGGIVDFSGTSGETYPAGVSAYHQLWNSGTDTKNLPLSVLVKDDLKTESTTTIGFGASAFNIEVRGDLNHQGITTGSGTGAIILGGTAVQNMSGNGNYRNLEVNKSSGNVNSSGRPTITGKLNLISGKILQASASDSITLGASATITETIGIDEAYVKGKLSTTRVVGTAAENFGGMGISLTAGANLGTVTATRQSGVVLTGDPSCCAGFTTIARNWHIVPTVQPSAANRNLSLSWPSEDDNLMNINSLQLWKRSSMVAVWQPIGDLQDVSATNPRVATWTGVSSFSQFTGADLDNPLPLGLMSFNGTNEKGNAVLRWQVSESERFTGYKVQKSEDGNSFRDLTFVTQDNEKSGTASHAFTDMNLITNSYYKIGLVNKSGKTEWSQVVYIMVGETSGMKMVLIPNPSADGTRLSMGGRFTGSDELQLSIFGTDGRNLGESRGKLDIINRDLPEMVKYLPKGIYQIRVISEPETKTLRFMKD